METQIYLTNLYDYYKDLLTDKQRSYFEDYYFENLTMEEIAENNNITRNAVSKSLMEVKEKLEYYEEKLSLSRHKEILRNNLDEETFIKIEPYI